MIVKVALKFMTSHSNAGPAASLSLLPPSDLKIPQAVCMAAPELSRKLRLILESSPDAPSLPHLLQEVTAFVSSHDADSLAQLEDELQQICIEIIDHSIYYSQIKIFLAVLYHLLPILPPSSIISTWFDLVLRPALREPKLPAEAVNHAKELILSALNPVPAAEDEKERADKERDKGHDRIRDFRRRLMDLYLLDAYNESSGNDVLEWAESDDTQKERTACWKANLEDVLVRLGMLRPQVGLVSRGAIALSIAEQTSLAPGPANRDPPLLFDTTAPLAASRAAQCVYLPAECR